MVTSKNKGIIDNVRQVPKKTSNLIIKRIYFPEGIYSNKKNQTEFKKILADYGLSWNKQAMKSYTNKSNSTTILTGMYTSSDQNKKVFCVYEGPGKPMTAIIKIVGSGGNFLIDLNSYCYRITCMIEDKDDIYINNMLLTLQEKGCIYTEKMSEDIVSEDIVSEDIQKLFKEKFEKRVNDIVDKWINVHRFHYDDRCEFLLWKRGVYNIQNLRKFRRMEIESNVIWAMENGF